MIKADYSIASGMTSLHQRTTDNRGVRTVTGPQESLLLHIIDYSMLILSPNTICNIINQVCSRKTDITLVLNTAATAPHSAARELSAQSAFTMSLKNQNIVITGASMGIGATIAKHFAAESANLILFARSEDKLQAIAQECKGIQPGIKVHTASVDVSSHESLRRVVANAVNELGPIDVLVNNAGLAIGAPNRFPDLTIDQIMTMSGTNINGFMFATYAALNEGKMKERNKGTILNVTSTTGLEVPPFPGEAVYHASKAFQEAFSNVLRTELVGTDIKVLALRPGVTATNFHELR